jgi:undecaprenyl phosphate-alpha-L-ara4FN deformylase
VGRKGVTNENYNEYLLSLVVPNKLNVLTIHAEVEGIACSDLFDSFLEMAQTKGVSFVPLGKLIAESASLGRAAIVAKNNPGREGWLTYQETKETYVK